MVLSPHRQQPVRAGEWDGKNGRGPRDPLASFQDLEMDLALVSQLVLCNYAELDLFQYAFGRYNKLTNCNKVSSDAGSSMCDV